MNFKELHQQASPLLICNVWDVLSAKTAQELNFKAIGTSSGAIAAMLGYNDGEEMSFQELEYIVERITKNVDLPLTVDLEAGYSRNPDEIAENIIRLSKLGITGINIEDSIVTDKREIVDPDQFSKTLEQVCSIVKNKVNQIFINVRTDTFLLNLPNPIQATIERGRKYQKAGVQGLFVPCIVKAEDIKSIIKEVDLPLNVMCMPNLPAFNILESLGVKRISMGNFVFNRTSKLLKQELKSIQVNNSFQNLFN